MECASPYAIGRRFTGGSLPPGIFNATQTSEALFSGKKDVVTICLSAKFFFLKSFLNEEELNELFLAY
jgi:hypothetical protein